MANTVLGTINVSVSPKRNADMAIGMGRNLLEVLGVATIAQAMAALKTRCNGTGIPNFAGLEIGDYIDGISLGGIAAPNGSGAEAPSVWSSAYYNNRIVIAGFNTYKRHCDMRYNHILFSFVNAIATGRPNPSHVKAGGYVGSEIRAWLEGADGLGGGPFAVGLKSALGGGSELLTITKYDAETASIPSAYSGQHKYTVFLPTEFEICGASVKGLDTLITKDRAVQPIQIPLFQKSQEYLVKYKNNLALHWWTATISDETNRWCCVYSNGVMNNVNIDWAYGISPLFCIGGAL